MSNNKEEEDFMNELKREFKATVAKTMLDFKSLYKEEKFDDIAKIAHDIKGTAGLFELKKGADIAMALQQAAQNKEIEKTKILIEELIAYMKEAGIIDKN
jgi:HPt (histidine-containing phosphotransfer) domain-containing protein